MADEVKNQKEYIEAWTDMMIEIWQEKIAKHNIVRSGALMSNFTSYATADSTLIKWAAYGIYQAFGTGRGYLRGNGGDFPFQDPDYRHKNRLDKPRKVGPAWGGYMTSGKPRKRRNWYSHKLYTSLEVFKKAMTDMYAHDALNTIIEGLK